MESVYLLIEREFIKTNEPIFKIGCSKQENDKRIRTYPKGSQLILQIFVLDCRYIETEIKNLFKNIYKQRVDIGIEYFEGDSICMRNDIFDIIKTYDKLTNNIVTDLSHQKFISNLTILKTYEEVHECKIKEREIKNDELKIKNDELKKLKEEKKIKKEEEKVKYDELKKLKEEEKVKYDELKKLKEEKKDKIHRFITDAFIKTDTDTDRIPLSDMLDYYNNWSPEKLLYNPFAKRINNHIKTEKKRINNKQVACICGYKWNTTS